MGRREWWFGLLPLYLWPVSETLATVIFLAPQSPSLSLPPSLSQHSSLLPSPNMAHHGKAPLCPTRSLHAYGSASVPEAPKPQTHLYRSSWNCLKGLKKKKKFFNTPPQQWEQLLRSLMLFFPPKIPQFHTQTWTKLLSTRTSLHPLPQNSIVSRLRSESSKSFTQVL